ncbi:hypothetical protein G647_01474 [Cladophialophora carrionii CBS 160.54]|uniref:Uncharacterized protein n=1 Tax=Cladophialophora carrionii CBS 160.54 TaxID=1279043 RepID=V9DQU5_9EURO|nr:uncharacterized protein G647_01474 [Cladophialophora carrionii CBS 160.54]ETI29021.1 hypothetical protein G647_01474 [Cladophialophora carrionii CBS 160.54]
MNSTNKAVFRKSFEEQKAKEMQALKRNQPARNSSSLTLSKATSSPATAIRDEVKTRVLLSTRRPAVRNLCVGETGRVRKPTTLKEIGTLSNDHVTKIAPKPAARGGEERPAVEEAERQARESIFVQANVVTVKEFIDARKGSEASKPAKVQSLPPHAAENTEKEILQPEGTSAPDALTQNHARTKPAYAGTARPRSAAPAAKVNDGPEQRRESASDDSDDSGTRPFEFDGRQKHVVVEKSDNEDGAPAPKRHCPETAGAPVSRACSKSPEDAIHEQGIVLGPKANPCKRKRDDGKDEFEHQPDNDRSRAHKLQRTDSGSDKENKRSTASSTRGQPAVKSPKRPAESTSAEKGLAKGSFADLMALAEKAQAENAKHSQQIGMIRHRPTARRVLSTRSTNVGKRVAIRNESSTTRNATLTDAQFEALRSAAETAQMKLDDALDLAIDPRPRKHVLKNLIGKTCEEKVRISKDRGKWHGIIHDFKEARKARKNAVAAVEAKAQISNDEKEPQSKR